MGGTRGARSDADVWGVPVKESGGGWARMGASRRRDALCVDAVEW